MRSLQNVVETKSSNDPTDTQLARTALLLKVEPMYNLAFAYATRAVLLMGSLWMLGRTCFKWACLALPEDEQ